jgi:hypothetical protein
LILGIGMQRSEALGRGPPKGAESTIRNISYTFVYRPDQPIEAESGTVLEHLRNILRRSKNDELLPCNENDEGLSRILKILSPAADEPI